MSTRHFPTAPVWARPHRPRARLCSPVAGDGVRHPVTYDAAWGHPAAGGSRRLVAASRRYQWALSFQVRASVS
jgi:hypothetical protein